MHNIAIIKTPIGFINIQTNSNAVYKIRFAYPNDNFMILTLSYNVNVNEKVFLHEGKLS